jgi:hypothetical protein
LPSLPEESRVTSEGSRLSAEAATPAVPQNPVTGARPADYNPFFERLVEETEPNTSDHLVGMLAYARYKSIKCEWTKKFRNDNNGAWPSRETVQIFLDAHLITKNLEGFRAEAEKQLYAFAEWYAEQVIDQQKDEMRRDVLAEQLSTHKSDIVNAVNRATGTGKALLINIGASAIFSAVIIIIGFIAFHERSPLYIGNAFSSDEATKSESAPASRRPE